MAAALALDMEQGATLAFHFVWKSQTGETDEGTPIYTAYDLTGCTARMQIRAGYGTDVLAEVTTEDGGIELERDGITGRVDVEVSATKTDAVAIKKPKADLEIEFPSGTVTRLLDITFTNTLNITRGTSSEPDVEVG